MRYEDAVRIEDLALAAHDAKLQYDALGLVNIHRRTPEEHRQLSVQYALSMATYVAAQGRLDLAQARMYLHGKL